MPTSPIKKNEFRGPFFGEKLSFITGLDQLGLQNTSEATYTLLVPGITNVTNRIRYFGFYCWLLDQYAKVNGSTNWQIYSNFIRRSELLIALLMQSKSPSITQIPGSSFASKMIEGHKNGIYYNLAEGADLLPEKIKATYWKYPLGALGQYYAGSMRTIGLITSRQDDPRIFIRTDKETLSKVSGKALADGFSAGIPQGIQSTFIKSIEAGKLALADIHDLHQYFNIGRVPAESLELDYYLEVLNDQDSPFSLEEEPASNRKRTLSLLLTFLKENPDYNWLAFIISQYQSRATLSPDDNTRFGWYFYQLNEYWQYACSTLLWSVLCTLDQQYQAQTYLTTLLEDLADAIIKELVISNPTLQPTTKINILQDPDIFILEEEEHYVSQISSCIKTPNQIKGAANAFSLILKLYQSNGAFRDQLKRYGHKHNILRDGNFIQYMETFQAKGNEDIKQFLQDFIYRNIICRHQFTAVRKMGNGQQSSQKFMLEDGFITLYEVVRPQFSMPRLQALVIIAQDLHLLQIPTQDNIEFTISEN